MKQLVITWFCCCLAGFLMAQADTVAVRKNTIRSYGIGVQHGFIFAHSEAVQNTKGANPTGVEMTISWQRNDAAVWDLCNCFPRKGLLLAFYDYDTEVLGRSATAAWFLEPTYRISNNWLFSFRAAGGLSYLTNPFDSIRNPTNQSYSTTLSGYLLLGAGMWIRLGDHWWINPSVNYQHISNGGTRQPNKGINWPTAGIALSYQPQKAHYYRHPRSKTKFWKDEPMRFDAIVFGNARRWVFEDGSSKRVALVGAGLQAARMVGRMNNLTATVEVYRDENTARTLQQDSINASAVKAGFSIGHEFILGKFLFSQRLGTYLFDQTPYNDKIFHRWGLQYRFHPQWSFGFNLQAHRHIADFIDFRMVYSWSKKR